MNRKLPHLVFAAAFSGLAALGVASDSDFVTDEIRGLHSELADTRRWVDSDIRANLAHRWETIPNRLAQRGFGWAESGLESLSWIPNADLAVESDSAGRLAGFSAGGTGLLWTGESAAIGFQPWGRWTDGGENDAASFGVFSRRALGDWGVVGGNVFADYAASAEFGDFARWSAGLDFQSALGELRGNYYAGLSSTRERVGLDSRVLAYAPSGVDAELRLRWFGGSEWSGFAEYEKWAGQFGDSDLEEVGYGLSFRPAGGGLLAGLQVDAGFRDSADSAGHWDLRLGYSRRLGADDSVRNSGSAFAVRSALVAPVAREREIRINETELPLVSSFKAISREVTIPSGEFVYLDDPEIHANFYYYPLIVGRKDVYSTDKGEVWHVEVPKFPGASITLSDNSGNGLMTVDAENRISIVSGARLVGGRSSQFVGYLTPVDSTVTYNLWVHFTIIDVEAPTVFAIPPIPKVAPGYIGALFTVSIVPPSNVFGFTFDHELIPAVFNHTGYEAAVTGGSLFYTDVQTYEISSANGALVGVSQGRNLIVSLRRPLPPNYELASQLLGFAWPNDYVDANLSLAFTIFAESPPSFKTFVQPFDFDSVFGYLPDKFTTLHTYHDENPHDGILIVTTGDLYSKDSFLPSSVFTVTAKITSPDFLGEMYAKAKIVTSRPYSTDFQPESCRIPANVHKTRENAGCGPMPNCELDVRLENAIRNEDVSAVCAAIAAGGNPRHQPFRTMLMEAVARNDTAMMTVLYHNGADINQRSELRSGPRIVASEHPLHRAAILANYEAGKFLLDNGANVDAQTFPLEDTPLHSVSNYDIGASPDKPMKFAQLLLDNDAEYNRANAYGHTPLYNIALGANVGPIRPLMQSGADLNKKIVDERGGTSYADYALVQAAVVDHTVAVSIMLEFKDSNRISVDVREEFFGLGAVHRSKSVNMARILADKGANLNLPSAPKIANQESGLTPLDYLAKRRRYEEVARFLHSRGARCSAENEDLEFCDFP